MIVSRVASNASMHSLNRGRSTTSSRIRWAKPEAEILPTLEPKRSERTAHLVLVVAKLVDQELSAGEQRAKLLARDRLDVYHLEPAGPDEVRQ